MTRHVLSLLALIAFAATCGHAKAQDYPQDILKKNPKAMAAWRAILPPAYRKVAWVARFNATAGPVKRIKIDGRAYLSGSVCMPHACGSNQVAFLIAADGSSASGAARTDTLQPAEADFGAQTPEMRAALSRNLSE